MLSAGLLMDIHHTPRAALLIFYSLPGRPGERFWMNRRFIVGFGVSGYTFAWYLV
jgi:hypothetical protein